MLKAYLFGALAVLFVLPQLVFAAYPDRGITFIVPYAAGGGTDTQARIAAATLKTFLNQSVVVVNKTGGNGVIGNAEAARARPDGYTLGFLAYPDLVIPPVYKKTPYKWEDFIYIATFNSTPVCLILARNAPCKTLEAFISYAKANPGKLTAGIASDSHMLGLVQLETKAGVSTTPVVYKSGSETLNALLGGHIDCAMIAPQFGIQAMQQGLPVVGVTSKTRVSAMQDVPTFKEAGFDIVMMMNRILVAPRGTPADVIKTLNAACQEAAKDPKLIESVTTAGDEFTYMNSKELENYIHKMNKSHLPVVRDNLKKFAR